jgi:GTP cyclohydrolase IA
MENTLLKIRNEASANKLENHSLSIIPAEDEEMYDHNHFSYSTETPLRENAFDLTESEKIAAISHHFKQILNVLGMDLTDESLKETPQRVAKMYVKEVFRGLNPVYKPEVKLFPNKYQYHQMLVEKGRGCVKSQLFAIFRLSRHFGTSCSI